jgi:quercetin dioxygenase-like cupin family protein
MYSRRNGVGGFDGGRIAFAMLPVVTLLLGGCKEATPTPTEGLGASMAVATMDHQPIHALPLTTPGHNQFTDDVAIQIREKPDGRSTEVVNFRDASNMAVGEFTIQPGAWFPWHTHPGAGLAAVVRGELVFIYADDCVERPYNEGEAFVDPGVVHTAYNPGDVETVVVATFLGVPADAPLATPVDPGVGRALNSACGTEAPIPGE